MQWHDDGIILGLKRHGESSVIAEVMTRAHGRHLGLVRGGRSRRMQAALQPGNGVGVTWRARLDEHLGLFQLEASEFRAARLMESPLGVHGVQALATLLRLLPERDPHPDLHDRLAVLLEDIDVPGTAGALYVRFELALLDELGFGLDLSACAASGTQTDLIYVSPKTGRAVSRSAGAPYAARLLELPAFLTDETRASPTVKRHWRRVSG